MSWVQSRLFHRVVELCQRIHHDPPGDDLNGLVVLRRVILEHARDDVSGIGRGAEHPSDALRDFFLPVGSDQQIEAWRGAVHLAHIGKAVGAYIDDLVDPEPIVEIRDLNHRRRLIKRECAGAVDHILVWAGDDALFRHDVVGELPRRLTGAAGTGPAMTMPGTFS